MLSEPIRKLVEKSAQPGNFDHEPLQTVELHKIISKAATLYEKARYLVDYREEHTIRRNAIERILRRKVFLERDNEVEVKAFLNELLSGEYLEQAHHTENLEEKIDITLRKFLALKTQATHHEMERIFISLAASEIDRHLSERERYIDDIVIDAFYQKVRSGIELPGLSERESDIQVYCALRRNLLREDNDAILYAIWIREKGITLVNLEESVHNELQWRIARRLKNETIFFTIIRDILTRYGTSSGDFFEKTEELDAYIKTFMEKKVHTETIKMRSAGLRAVVYLFLTKVILALLIELPYELYVLGTISIPPLATNILFHPILLFFLTRGVGAVSKKNTDAAISGVHDILYKDKVREIKIRTISTPWDTLFGGFYLIFIVAVFTVIATVLYTINFSWISIILFLFFITLVSYFAFRIRYNALRWKIVRKEGVLREIGRSLIIPVVNTGQWLTRKFSSINVIVFVMDFIIETPFKFVLNISNQFITYLKEKNEEMY